MSRLHLVLALMLAACGPSVGAWTKTSASEEQQSRDLLECETAARETVARDQAIRQDELAARQPDMIGGGTPVGGVEFSRDLRRYDEENRRRHLIGQCMTGRGYRLESQPTAGSP